MFNDVMTEEPPFELLDEFGLSEDEEIQVDRAVAANARYASSLGWQTYYDQIARLLGFTNITPDQRAFAEAVAGWQLSQGMARSDGIIGPDTWARLRAMIGITAPSQSPSSSGVTATPRATSTVVESVHAPLPPQGPGFYSYARPERQFATPQVISAVLAIGRAWHERHPADPRIGIGEISLRGGGPISGHHSHQRGLDVDLYPMRLDGREGVVVYHSPQYSRSLTQELVNLIRRNGVLPVNLIFFNDRAVVGVRPWPKHDNHMHVRFADAPNDQAASSLRESNPGDELDSEFLLPESIVYNVSAGEEFGPVWRNRRPPGLPSHARLTSKAGAAYPYVIALATEYDLGASFVNVVRHLAQTESGGRFALPANTFDARPQGVRPSGIQLITAWGAFQFNRDAWRALSGVARTAFPWDSTPYEEIARPIEKYAICFLDARDRGGSDLYSARGVRLWQRSPSREFPKYLSRGETQGFAAAWQAVPDRDRSVVDNHLRSAGILL